MLRKERENEIKERKTMKKPSRTLALLVALLVISVLVGSYLIQSVLHTRVEMEFETIAKGLWTCHMSLAYYVIQNQSALIDLWNSSTFPDQLELDNPRNLDEWMDEWADYWNQTRQFPPGPPEIDFSQSTVIAVFMGARPTGGYAIEIENINVLKQSVVVNVVKTYPSKECYVMMIGTEPFHLIITEKINQEITFDTAERTAECP